jgi:hypothetical protein
MMMYISFVLKVGLVAGLAISCGGSASNNASTDKPQSTGAMVPPPPPGSGEGRAGLSWDVPQEWVSEQPSSQMRKAQYRVTGDGGDAECVVYYFGPGQGGDARANAERWAGQFTQPDGRPSAEVMKESTLDVHGVSVLMVEVTGSYRAGPMMGGASEPKHDYMLVGAIAQGPDANWFFKLTGPERTVRANREHFDSMIRTLKPGK